MGARSTIFSALEEAGIPAAEDHFREDALGALGAHVVVRREGTDTLFCNGAPYMDAEHWSVTLYSPARDEATEWRVFDALREAGLPIGTSSSGYDDEHRVHWCQWDFDTLRKFTIKDRRASHDGAPLT